MGGSWNREPRTAPWWLNQAAGLGSCESRVWGSRSCASSFCWGRGGRRGMQVGGRALSCTRPHSVDPIPQGGAGEPPPF